MQFAITALEFDAEFANFVQEKKQAVLRTILEPGKLEDTDNKKAAVIKRTVPSGWASETVVFCVQRFFLHILPGAANLPAHCCKC